MRITGIPKISILVFFLGLGIFSGCAKENALEQARVGVRKSEAYYQRALRLYQDLLSRGRDVDRVRLELGKLYYDHGDFKAAAGEFKQVRDPEGRRFLAITCYRLGEFTEALEIFRKHEINDDEYNYYYGLTCEKLNLFDQALDLYGKLKSPEYADLARKRANLIEKQPSKLLINEADPQVAEIIKNSPAQETYPQAGALILFCDEQIEVTAEDTQVSYLHYVVKILNERGKEEFAETRFDYDSTDEKVDLVYARTIKPDGEVVDVGTRHIRDVSKYINFPLYSNARVRIISFPEITEGAVVEYKMKVSRSQLINKKDFVLAYPVQASQPIIRANFTVSLPEGRSLAVKALNEQYNNFSAGLAPLVEKKDGRVYYRWNFKDLPQIIAESNMPPTVEVNPTVLLSTFSSWKEVYDWWWPLAKGKIAASPEIKDKVGELLRGQNSEQEKISAIYNFCARQIRYVAVEYGQAGYEPHQAADVFRNKYGDCKDQAVLLVTMLRDAGFTAWPLLISTRDDYDLNEDFPSVLFNHCIAAVATTGGIVFLDPTAETCSFGDLPAGDQGRRILLIKDDGYAIESTPLYAGEHNLVRQTLKLKINADESIIAQRDVFTTGAYGQAQRYWLLYTAPELIRQVLEEKIHTILVGAHLDQYEIRDADNLNQPVTLSYSFHGTDFLTGAGNLRIMPQLSELDASLTAKEERKYPIRFEILDTRETIIEVEMPRGFAVKYTPEGISQETPWFNFTSSYTIKDGRLYFRQRVEVKNNTVSCADYADFKKMFSDLAKRIKQRVVLTK